VLSFLLDNFPSAIQIASLVPASMALALGYLHLAGALKRDRGWRTGYTRKVFHFLVFTTAAGVQVLLGVAELFCFGAGTSAVLLYAIARGDGDLLYEAIARESDAPRRTYFIVVPYVATLAGGLLSNAAFGSAAIFGYLVAGLGDAVGEPVGTRFGRHRYRVPSARGVVSHRSVEGSVAVFAVSLLAIGAAQLALKGAVGEPLTLSALALAVTLVEAISPHGWDNLTLQVVPSALGWWMS
jgi:phytol kinase